MTQRYNLALFSVIRDEARYLREWLAYHFLPGVGVEHVYLHAQDEPDTQEFRDTEAVLAPYIKAGLVTVFARAVYRDPTWQLRCWRDLLDAYGAECRWACLTDADCFLFAPGKQTVPLALRMTEQHEEAHFRPVPIAGVAVYTCTFGSNGAFRTQPMQTEAFVRRAYLDHPSNWTPNYILKPEHVMPATLEAGYRVPRPGYQIIDTAGNVVTGIKKQQGPLDRLRLNHYSVRSREDWARKVARGWPDAAGNWTDPNHTIADHKLAMLDRNEVLDDSLPRRFGPALKMAMGHAD